MSLTLGQTVRLARSTSEVTFSVLILLVGYTSILKFLNAHVYPSKPQYTIGNIIHVHVFEHYFLICNHQNATLKQMRAKLSLLLVN